MASDDYFFPIDDSIEEYWPGDSLALSDSDPLGKIWISPVIFEESDDYSTLEGSATLLFEESLTLDVLFIAGVSISIGEPDIGTEIPFSATISNLADDGSY